METQMLMFLAMCSAISPKELIQLCGPIHPSAIRYALVKYGGGIIQMSGSIAGVTHARNRYGNYVRARTKPVNPNTARQDAMRSVIAFLTDRWANTLTAVQRIAWNLYASNVAMKNKLGETINLSGFNHYIRSNAVAKNFSLTLVDAGPVVFELPAQDPLYSIVISEATQQISTTYDDGMDWASETGANLLLSGGQPQNAQRNFFGGPWRLYGQMAGADGAPPAPPHGGASPFAVAEGQHVWCYARIRRADGRLSEPFRADIIVAA